MKKWTIGVDVGGTEVKFGLFDDKLQEKWSIPTNIQDKGAHILPEIAESVVERCRASGIHKEDLAGIGIGLPGPVLGGNIVKGCVNLGWAEIPVADELSRLLEAAFEQKEGNSSGWEQLSRCRQRMTPMWQRWARCGLAAAKTVPAW